MITDLDGVVYILLKRSVNIFQTASYRKNRIPKQPHDLNWARKKGGSFDENITTENKEFLDKAVVDKYKVIDSPLKEGPWAKGEFNPNGV